MDPLRVALVSSSYAPYPGGVEEHTASTARELTARGHAVEVWTVDRGEHLGVRTVDGVRVRYLPTPLPNASPRGVASFLLAAPYAWSQWRAARRSFRPDLLHVHCFGPNGVYALAVSARDRIPLIVTSHGETMADDHDVFSSSWMLRTALEHALRCSAAVTAPSQLVLDDLRARFGLRGPAEVVPNGVAGEVADHPSPPETTLPPWGGPTVIAVGRVERMKGFDLLLEAWPGVEPATARLVIAGDGSQLDALTQQAERLGIRERVLFLGRVPRAAVFPTVGQADAMVVPSRVEAFGIVVLEAWRCGVPLVATRRGGPGALVTDGVDGLLVDPEDAAALAAAVSRVLLDRDLARRLSDAGRESVRQYSWPAVAEAYEAIYQRAVAGLAG